MTQPIVLLLSLRSLIVTTGVIALTACQPKPQTELITLSGPTMGTDYRISVVLDKHPLEQGAQVTASSIEQGVIDILHKINQTMSTYLNDSELSQFNALGANQPFQLSLSLFDVIDESLSLSKLTAGAFDVTVKPLVDLWGFGPVDGIKQLPDDNTVAQMKQYIGYDKLLLSDNTLQKTNSKVTVDLSAIAKGYAVDAIARYLEQKSINNFLINVGGELKAAGINQDGAIWRVGIEKPQQLGGVQQIIELPNKAIATSGDYRNFVVIDEVAYSHTIDPRQSKPVTHSLASVSVIADNASTADALATALMVMGDQEASVFAERHQIAAYFVLRSDMAGLASGEAEAYQIRFTQQFAPYLQ